MGKGDNLIAGYNTASKAEREETMTATWSFVGLPFVACIIVVILANTWAKKKSN